MVKSIESLARGLRVLRAMQRRRHCSLADLYHETAIPRPTLRRILKTLSENGWIQRSASDDLYRCVDPMLEDRFQLPAERLLARCAQPLFEDFHNEVGYSISLGVREAEKVAIILSTLTRFPGMRGRYTGTGGSIHMLASALGRALIGSMTEAERTKILEKLSGSPEEFDRVTAIPGGVEGIVSELRGKGYSERCFSYWDRYSEAALPLRSIAVPVFLNGSPVAAVAVGWPDDEPFDAVVARTGEPLKSLAGALEMSIQRAPGSKLLDLVF